ncbi:MAG: hypothetical protein RMJ35_02970 [Phycisphaerales bacterium]|nr:hypothetical protein [Phycisphaerales bacterium]
MALLAMLAGGLVAFRFVAGRSAADAAVLDEDDAVVARALKNDFPREAREWLKVDSTWMMGGWNARQAESRIADWYRMGAKRVICFGTRMALWVAIELPDDPEQRKALFEWQKKWHSEMFERVRTDKGQKYLVIKLRL